MKRSKGLVFVIAAAAAIAAVAAGALFLVSRRARQADLRCLRQTEYDAVFFSMVPYRDPASDAIGADALSYYIGVDAAVMSSCLRNAGDLDDYLEAAFYSGNEIGLAYLELVPFRLGDFGGLSNWIAAYPDTVFHILLNAPSMDYWTSLGEGRAQKQLAAYQELAGELLGHGNVELYFMGAEDWLIMNPGNYTAPLVANRELAPHLALLTWQNDRYRLTADNYTAVFTGLWDKVGLAGALPESPELSGWRMVFFGDSVIGNYRDSTSIPSAAAALSGCEAYNLGVGGTPAAFEEPSLYSFTVIVDSILKREAIVPQNGVPGPKDLEAYYEKANDGKRLCFVINYGLNDYFGGARVENPEDPFDPFTYAGALRSGIRELREAFPESVIVLAAPNYTDAFSHGQDRQSDVGGSLTDYVEAAGRVAQDTNVLFMDNYHDLGIDASNWPVYLADNVHPDKNGRFLYARALVRLIWNNCAEAGQPQENL